LQIFLEFFGFLAGHESSHCLVTSDVCESLD